MTASLPELLRTGFPVGERWLEWGITLGEAAALLDTRIHHGRHLKLPEQLGFFGPIVTCGVGLTGPRAGAPVTQVTYELPGSAAVHTPEGLGRVRATLEEVLGPGEHETHAIFGPPASCVPNTSSWAVGPHRLGLSAFGDLREGPGGVTSGSLFLDADEGELAVALLPAWQARRPWHGPGGEVDTVVVRGIQPDTLGDRGPAWRALWRPQLLPAPAWMQTGPDTVGLWRHEGAGVWGLCVGEHTVVFELDAPVALTWIRMTPARGRGAAYLSLVDGPTIVATAPGCDGLDALVARLRPWPGVTLSAESEPDV